MKGPLSGEASALARCALQRTASVPPGPLPRLLVAGASGAISRSVAGQQVIIICVGGGHGQPQRRTRRRRRGWARQGLVQGPRAARRKAPVAGSELAPADLRGAGLG
eukprot:scaffold1183_cov418-Prasinococcus_capsulatus_cf.AAC.33